MLSSPLRSSNVRGSGWGPGFGKSLQVRPSIALEQQLQWLSGTGYILRAVRTYRSRRAVTIDPQLAAVAPHGVIEQVAAEG
jgi:hypothetical protein